MKPKTAQKWLTLSWALPSVQKNYKCAPLEYIASIFDNDGDGGLASYLIEQRLISNLTSYTHKSSYSGNSQFCMRKCLINLTDLGANNIEKILEMVFSYLLMIKETPIEDHRRLYNELKQSREITFKYHSESSALTNVQSLITPMMLYDDVDILQGSNIFQNFDGKVISDIIELLNRRKFNTLIINNEREHYNKKEKYYEVEYDDQDFPENYQRLWDERVLNSNFHLAEPSPLKATNFEIFENSEDSPVSIFTSFNINFRQIFFF